MGPKVMKMGSEEVLKMIFTFELIHLRRLNLEVVMDRTSSEKVKNKGAFKILIGIDNDQ